MVMPCSRSPQPVGQQRQVVYRHRGRAGRLDGFQLVGEDGFESNSNRPISVDLPSSTEPAVANRNDP